MNGVIFDIEGDFAHFRKFYTNSSSLSYTVPPRTTIMGIIAAMMGEERDSYYKSYHSSQLHLGVKKNGGTRMICQTLNYNKVVNRDELYQPTVYTQIPFEMIRGVNGKVSYRIVAAFEDTQRGSALEERLKTPKFVYPPTLGTAFFMGDVHYVGSDDFTPQEPGEVAIDTALSVDSIIKLHLKNNRIIREKMPVDFKEDRSLMMAKAYLVDDTGNPIGASVNETWYHGTESNLNIMFL